MQCGRCKFWSRMAAGGTPIKDERHGECRRWTPVMYGSSVRGAWPHTGAEDWCGEFLDTGQEEG